MKYIFLEQSYFTLTYEMKVFALDTMLSVLTSTKLLLDICNDVLFRSAKNNLIAILKALTRNVTGSIGFVENHDYMI